MGEVNQNVETQRKGIAISPYKSTLRNIAENRRQIKQKAEDESFNHLSASSMELDNQAYKVNNEELNKEYKKNSQLAAVSYMVKYAAKQNGADWSNLTTVSDIMSNYFNKFPETAPQIKEFINSDRDPEEFGVEMGWIESDNEEKSLNRLERVWSDIKHPFDILTEGIYDMAGNIERKYGNPGYADTLALDDYAVRKYGKTIERMTEDEIARLELDLDLENAKNGTYIMGEGDSSYSGESPYQTSIDRQRTDVALTEMGLGGLLTYLEARYPKATVGLVGAAETPVLNLPIQLLGLGGNAIGELISMFPGVSGWIESLPEDVQQEVKSLGGMFVLGKMIGKGTVKDGQLRPRLKNSLKNISESEIIGGIMDYVSGLGDKVKDTNFYKKIDDIVKNPGEWGKKAVDNLWKTVKEFPKSSEYKKLEKEWKRDDARMDSAGRISGANGDKAIEQTEIFKNELERLGNDVLKGLDRKGITYEDLYDALETHSGWYETWEDGIYSRDTKRYKPGETTWTQKMKDVDTGISANPKFVDPIGNGIDILKRIYKSDRDMIQTLEIVERKWEKVGLTRAEANQLARQIAEGARIYKESSRDMYTAEYVQEIEQARRDLKDWARASFEKTVPGLYKALEYLDNAWSDNLNSKSMIKDNMQETRSRKNNYPRQEDWQKKGGTISRTLNSKGKNVADSLFQSRAYNPITREAGLRDNIKNFIKNNKNEGNGYEKSIKDWYDATFRDVVNPDGTYYNVGEGEVIYPKKSSWRDNKNYLEDIVEIVNEIAEEGGQKYGSLESQLRGLGLSENEIAAAERVFKIVQEPLEGMGGETKPVATSEGGVMKSDKSSKKTNSDKK